MTIMEGQVVAIVLLAFVAVVFYLYRRPRNVTFIEKPALGLLDLSSGVSTADVNIDRETLRSLFNSVSESTSQSPKCDVLFVYCQLEIDGRIRGSDLGLRELIRESGASVVVVASDNNAEGCIAASKKKGYGNANLVMTISRKGDVFGRFFHKLFSAMKQGISMPLAWVTLAPQIPGRDHPDVPDSIFLCEAGQVAFR